MRVAFQDNAMKCNFIFIVANGGQISTDFAVPLSVHVTQCLRHRQIFPVCADGGIYNTFGYGAFLDFASGSFSYVAVQNNNATKPNGIFTATNGAQIRTEYLNRTNNGGSDFALLDSASQAFSGDDFATLKFDPAIAPRVRELQYAKPKDFLFADLPQLGVIKQVCFSLKIPLQLHTKQCCV
jgi:hypothetical protein